LAHVAWIVEISMDILHISHGFMEISLISHDGKTGFTGFNDAYHCVFVIAIACCAL